MIEIWGDGSSTGRADREWGWGLVVVKRGVILYQAYGGGPSGTNNVAEIESLIQGMCWAINNKITEEIQLVSDSQYALGIISGEYTPKKNLDLVALARKLASCLKISFRKVRGHAGIPMNELADQLSKQGKEIYAKKK